MPKPKLKKKRKKTDNGHVADKEDKRARLWLLTLATSEAKALTQPHWQIEELAWLPSGDRIIVSATDHPESDQNTNRIFIIQVSDSTIKQLAAPRGPFHELRVSPDGKTISYVGCRGDGPTPHDLVIIPAKGGAPRNLTGANLDRPAFQHIWLTDDSIAVVAGNGFHTELVAFSSDGMKGDRNLLNGITNPVTIAVNREHAEFAFVGQTAIQPQELWLWDQKSPAKQISHFNDSWKQFTLSAPEFYKYKSFDGLEIEAALLKPSSYKSKLPLIALIHGGPTGNWQDSLETWGQLLAARGYVVVYPNIRGSSGYGQKFIEMNRGDWGGGDYRDVMAGVDDLVVRGIANPERLAIGGWSYGGYMAEWAITQTTRFKAAVSGTGLANLISEYGTEQGPSYDEWFYGVPYEPEKVAGFLNSSPFVHLKNAKTPTFILQGDADVTDPLGQSPGTLSRPEALWRRD